MILLTDYTIKNGIISDMNITVIGGGTGTSVVLEGLKKHRDLNLSVIVGMMDDGGSNAVIRDEFGLLPLSDVRKSIIALSENNDNEVLRRLFMYRFSNGEGIKGHTLGNLLMIAMADTLGSEVESIEMFKNMFGVRGDIIPVTLDKVKLVAQYSDGSSVVGEHLIDEPSADKNITQIALDSPARATESAVNAILKADYIIFGPGDLYTTTIPNILVDGIPEAIKKSHAKMIYIANLMTKIGQTRGKGQTECLRILEKYAGRKADYVLVNNGKIPDSAYQRYLEEGEDVIKDDLSENSKRKIIRKDLVADGVIKRDKGDVLVRSLVRHDSDKLANELIHIFNSDKNRIASLLRSFLSNYKD
ncbi:MAG TPA: YvcK family protein [Candidatus Dojkabacteria bacterium]|nr:YvcK family protein [Candidatus Dojkabacteria bacterium]